MIKLHKAGILGKVMEAWECLVPGAVYEETVERGIKEAYPDAEEIGELVRGRVRSSRDPRAQRMLRRARSLGKGEREALHLFFSEGADAIVSDDRAFLSFLREHSLPALPPALVLVELVGEGIITPEEGLEALERMRGLIRESMYSRAREKINKGG